MHSEFNSRPIRYVKWHKVIITDVPNVAVLVAEETVVLGII